MSVHRWALLPTIKQGTATLSMIPAANGEYVTYADHVAALAERDRLFAETLEAIQRLHDDTNADHGG